MIRACLFDLDGVIVDTARFHFLAWKALASSLDIEFTESQNENLKGVGRMESLDYILGLGGIELGTEKKKELAEEKNIHYKRLVSKLGAGDILPGVVNFLEELRENDIRIGLGSSSKNARPVLEYLQITSYFDVIVDGTDIKKSKPDPEVFELGARSLNIDPSMIVVFEDAQAGIEAANTGGFISVAVGSPEDLKGARLVIPGFKDFTLKEMQSKLEG